MALTNEEIRLALQNALLGEIYSDIRAIAYAYDSKKKYFLIRYYLNRKPNQHDYDSASSVMAEFISNFKFTEFEEVKEECQYCELPPSELDVLDGFIYFRKEE